VCYQDAFKAQVQAEKQLKEQQEREATERQEKEAAEETAAVESQTQ